MYGWLHIGKEYYVIKDNALTFPHKCELISIDYNKDTLSVKLEDESILYISGCDSAYGKLLFDTSDNALFQLACYVKKDLTGVFDNNRRLMSSLPRDRFSELRRKMQYNLTLLNEYVNEYDYVDFNFDLLAFKVHNGRKILTADGGKYHCNQFYLLYDIVIDVRVSEPPIKLFNYMEFHHSVNPDMEFELEYSLCSNLNNSEVTYKFDYVDLIK